MRRLLSLLAVLSCTTSEPEKATQDEAPAALSLSALRYQPKSEEQAVAQAQAVLQKAPDQIQAWEMLAIALIRRFRETSNPEYNVLATDLIGEARARFPKDPSIQNLHLMMLEDEHRFREARDAARTLLDRHPENVTAWILYGDALMELGTYEEAVAAYQRAMDLKPDLRSYNRGAYLRWLHGDFDGALQMMELALDAGSSRDPEPRAWCYVDLANMYLHRGDAARASKALELALALVPGYLSAFSLLARVALLEGDRDRAMGLLSESTGKKAETADLLLLAELAEAAGRKEAAARAFERAVKLGDHDPRPLAHHLARHRLDPEKALALAARARKERPTIEADDTYALAALRAEKLNEAQQSIERATRLGTLDANFWLHRALIEAARGKAEAKQSLGRALELNPNVDPLLLAEARKAIPE